MDHTDETDYTDIFLFFKYPIRVTRGKEFFLNVLCVLMMFDRVP